MWGAIQKDSAISTIQLTTAWQMIPTKTPQEADSSPLQLFFIRKCLHVFENTVLNIPKPVPFSTTTAESKIPVTSTLLYDFPA